MAQINPAAFKADVNPADRNRMAIEAGYTGWDNYLDENKGGGGGGGSGMNVDDIIKTIQMSPEDVALLKSLDISKLSPKDFEAEALAELTPYYERILAEANYDIDEAKRRIVEDYQSGVRKQAEDLHTSLKTLLGQDLPAEEKAQLADLNKRGMLGTLLNRTRDAMPRTQSVNATFEQGTAAAPYTQGQPITATYTPSQTTQNFGTVTQEAVTPAQFGGLAGKTMANLATKQDARLEAINRAFKRYNEEANLGYKRDVTENTLTKSRKARDIEQEKAEKIPVLAGEKYQRKVDEYGLKRATILEPYQLKAQGISY